MRSENVFIYINTIDYTNMISAHGLMLSRQNKFRNNFFACHQIFRTELVGILIKHTLKWKGWTDRERTYRTVNTRKTTRKSMLCLIEKTNMYTMTETAKRQIKTHLGILNSRKKKEKQRKCQELLLCGKIQDPFAFPTSGQLPPEQSKV